MTLPHCLTFCHYLLTCQNNDLSTPPLPHRRQTLLNLSSPIHPQSCDADAALVGVFMHSALEGGRHLIHHHCRKHRRSHSGWCSFSHAVLLRCICLIYNRRLSKGICCLRIKLCPYLPYILPHSLSLSIFLSPLSCQCCHAYMVDPWREYTHMYANTHTHTHTHTHTYTTRTTHMHIPVKQALVSWTVAQGLWYPQSTRRKIPSWFQLIPEKQH